MNKENKQNELPLCQCGCGERVTKLGNVYIQYHYKENNEFNKQRRLDFQKLQIKQAKKRHKEYLQFFPKERSLLWTIILLPIKIILWCIWWPIKIVFGFLFASFIMAVAPFLYVLVIGTLQILAVFWVLIILMVLKYFNLIL